MQGSSFLFSRSNYSVNHIISRDIDPDAANKWDGTLPRLLELCDVAVMWPEGTICILEAPDTAIATGWHKSIGIQSLDANDFKDISTLPVFKGLLKKYVFTMF